MHRVTRRAAFGAALLALAIAAPAAADTTGDNGNLDIAYGSSDDGGTYAELDRDNFTGDVGLVVRVESSTQISCTDSSAGWIWTSFYGVGTPATYSFGHRQSSASASGFVTGTLSTTNTCENSETQVNETHAVSLRMAGSTKLTTTTTTKTVAHNPDGTRTIFTYKTTEAAGVGSVTVDDASTALTGAIVHREFSTTTK
jgi:hypothetical protein